MRRTRELILLLLLMGALVLGGPGAGRTQGPPASGLEVAAAALEPAAASSPPVPAPTAASDEKSLAEQLSPWWAFPIGLLGSAAYLVAMWVGMVGRGGDARERVLACFRPWSWLKVPLYLASGGGVALVFQLPEKRLVPIQAFIIGCTWPAVVANYLSGRQTGVPDEALEAAEQVRQQKAQLERLRTARQGMPEPPVPADAGRELDALLEKLKDHQG